MTLVLRICRRRLQVVFLTLGLVIVSPTASHRLSADDLQTGFANAQDIAFQANHDGTSQRYVLVLPKNFKADQPVSLLIALHGHGSDRWQFVKSPRDECKAARDAATKHDMIFISPDYRAKTSWMGPAAEADMLQIIAETKRQFKIAKVILCGGSMGGSSSLTFAALHPHLIDGVASMNGTANHLEYQNFQDAIRKSFGGTKVEIPNEYKKRSAEYWPEKFTMPVGVTTGGKDKSVPPESVLRLVNVLRQLEKPVLSIHRDQTGHSTNYEDGTAILEYVIEQAKLQE